MHTAILVAIAVPSVILHEISHGWAALRLGDDTAKRRGRLTLNPIAHIDPVGTILLPAMMAASGVGVIGYAKPVPVNVSRLRNPRDHAVLVSLAGPATNLVLAALAAVGVRALGGFDLRDFITDDWTARVVLSWAGLINVFLALFNLLPVPPLDGSALVERLVPRRHLASWYRLRPFSIVLVFAVVLLTPAGEWVLESALDVWEVFAG